MKSPLRILYLEDVPRDVELVHGLLAADGLSCDIVRVESKADFAAELDRGRIDLILSDYTVPSFDGFSALTLAQAKLPHVPFIFVSGTIGEESGVITLKAGATDYVLKNRLSRLVPAIRRALRDAEQRVEREQALNELRKAAERSLSQQSALINLIRSDALEVMNLTATLQQITEAGARTLRVDRLSVWRLTPERRAIRCVDLYERGPDRHTSGMELQAASYPRYFQALSTREIIVTDKAAQDPLTAELAADYLTAHGVTAMVDVPIYLFGNLEGVLCAEHIGLPRRWMQDEQMFAMALSNLVSLVYMHGERKRAEEALRKSEERFRLVARATNDAVWDWDLLTSALWWNEGFQALFGYRPEEIEPGVESRSKRLHPDDRERVMKGIHKVINSGRQAWEDEYRFRCADGSYALVMDRGYVLHDETGRPVRMIGSMMDVTDRKRSEERIREQAALLDIAHDAIVVRDLDDRIQYWNRGAERLYGWTAEEAIGKTTGELLYQDPPPVLDDARRFLLRKGQWAGQINQVTKEKKNVVVESRWSLVRNRAGAPTSILEVNSDITEKKLMEHKFLQSQRLENLGTLAGGIAHDLNNILTPIIIAAQLLRTNLTEEQRQQWFSMVEVSAQRGAEMVKQVLSFARGVESERDVLQIQHVMSELGQMVKETFPRSIQVHTEAADDLWAVRGDFIQLYQVLLNLCLNARDAMPDGGTLRMAASNYLLDEHAARVQVGARPGPHVVLSVTDTGCGMPAHVIDKIFDPFFTTKERGKGTGLGLSTALGIVQSHGGFINVFSEMGKGTQMQIFLPAEESIFAEHEDEAKAELLAGRGELVLIVDDEAAILAMMKSALEVNGYRVLTAGDGKEAVAMYAKRPGAIDVVVTDMMMPLMDGYTTMRELQALDPTVKLIAVSGLPAGESFAGVAGGASIPFLPKPYTTDKLLTLLRQVLG